MTSITPTQATVPPRPKRSGGGSFGRSDRRLAGILLSPALALIALVAAYPIFYAIWLSLNEYSVRVPGLQRFAGADNYREAIGPSFWDAFGNTMLFTGVSVALELVIGLAMAVAMHSAFKGRGLLRATVLVPWATITAVTAITWRSIFEPGLGFAPQVLEKIGIAEDVIWLGENGYAMAVLILADVWKTAPFMALLLLAGLQVIPEDVYEAAKVDGATTWQRFLRITIPLLIPAILVALIFRTLDALRIFDLPKVLTDGSNGTNVLSLLAYQELTDNRLIGLGAALSVLTFVIVMVVSFLYIRFVGGNIKTLAED
ncbi:MAG: carbohydrate transporter rane protein 1, family [Thermoleophilia bacterium]|nr:carbohydrate transporter rane protein 1, family [Thermoleophilia bacterium]MCZ4495427.1 carbohydrate transporter rane protein 1, family [Thermoleophilia bacterium]